MSSAAPNGQPTQTQSILVMDASPRRKPGNLFRRLKWLLWVASVVAICVLIFAHLQSQERATPKTTQPRHEHKLYGLRFLSPIGLTNLITDQAVGESAQRLKLGEEERAAVRENARRLEGVFGETSGLMIGLSRRSLLPDDTCTPSDIAEQIGELVERQYPQGFNSKTQDMMIGSVPAKRLSLQWKIQEKPAEGEYLIIIKQPYLWQLHVLGRSDVLNLRKEAQLLFDSVEFLVPDSESNLPRKIENVRPP